MKRIGEEDLLGLIDAIYGVAEEPQGWTMFLERLTRTLDGKVSGLIVQDPSSMYGNTEWLWGVDPALHDLYSHYAPQNVFLGRALPRLSAGMVLTDEQVISKREVKKTEYFNEFLTRVGALPHFGACVVRTDSCIALLTVGRDINGKDFGATETALVGRLLPHLQRAVSIRQRMESLVLTREATSAGLDRLSVGLALLDSSGNVSFANAEARSICESNDGLTLSRDRLVASHSTDGPALRALIAAACTTGNRTGISPGGALAIRRPSRKRPFALLVSPLRLGSFALTPSRPAAIAFISDPERGVDADDEVLRQLYGLTPAEASLAASLAAGLSLEEAAERRGITIGTARMHLKSVFAKTGVRRQAELVSLLLRGIARVRRGTT